MTSTLTERINGIQTSAAWKLPCRVATTANITLSGTQTIDGVAVVADDRVLVKDQTDTTENGIYLASATEWTRAEDFDGNRDVVTGTLIYVHSGTAGGEVVYVLTTSGDIVIGTSNITFSAVLTALLATAAALTVLDDATVAAMVDTLGGATSTGTGGLARAVGPTFTGTPLAPSASADTNTTQIATTAFVLGQAASQAEQETGSSTTKYVTPGRQQYHASAVKAWANVDRAAGTPSLNSPSYNITSVTDDGAANTLVTIATDFSTSVYSFGACAIAGAGRFASVHSQAAGAFDVLVSDDTGAGHDTTGFTCWAMGDQ